MMKKTELLHDILLGLNVIGKLTQRLRQIHEHGATARWKILELQFSIDALVDATTSKMHFLDASEVSPNAVNRILSGANFE